MEHNEPKIAIIGASTGQLPLCRKAREMGLRTICFAWEEGAVCKEEVDRFYPISVLERDRIVECCREEGVRGVVSNASDLLAETVAYVAEKLSLPGTPYEALQRLEKKSEIRLLTRSVAGLKQVESFCYRGEAPSRFPCIVKPVTGASKRGVSFVERAEDFAAALAYAQSVGSEVIVEEFIPGREISVETLSSKGKHFVVQLTDKQSSGAPHFVELGHHQPARLTPDTEQRIRTLVPELLTAVGYTTGAAHIELKITPEGEVALIEINPRGGGDHISSRLVELSTGYDYLQGMIQAALGELPTPTPKQVAAAGVCYLCLQSAHFEPLFDEAERAAWCVELCRRADEPLHEATGNYDRNGHLIYCARERIDL